MLQTIINSYLLSIIFTCLFVAWVYINNNFLINYLKGNNIFLVIKAAVSTVAFILKTNNLYGKKGNR
jgi:hypothetical protein